MTLEEYNNNFEKATIEITKSIGQTMALLGNDALAVIKKRVQEEGKDAKGKEYASYSTKPMLANCSSMTSSACQRIAGSKEKRKELKWVTLKRGGKNIRLFQINEGYKQFRELHGRQTSHVDFTFYGTLWGGMRIISSGSEHNNGIVTVGPGNETGMKILEGNVKKRGQILDLSSKEITELAQTFKLKTLNILERHGI